MPSGLFEYSAVRAKTSAMRAKHLTAEQYSELTSKSSVAEALSYLKNNTVYAPLFDSVSEKTLHRGEFERILDDYMQSEVQKLYNFCSQSAKKILSYTYIRYEIEIIKRVLRALYSGRTIDASYSRDGFFANKLSIDPIALSHAANIREFLQVIANTPYFDVLNPVLTSGTELFVAESSLDIYYFKYIWQLKDKVLSGQDKKLVAESFGSEIDMKNLCWIYRQKRFYNTPGELIYATIIPIHYKIRKETLIALAQTPDLQSFVTLAKTTGYEALFYDLDNRFIEQNYDELSHKRISRLMRNNPFSIASLTGYTHFLQDEMSRIITAIESIRYQTNVKN